MTINGYELFTEWNNSNIGETAMAKKGGKTFFLKKYGEFKAPIMGASMTPALYDRLMTKFNEFKSYRTKVNELLRSMAGPGGNIIAPSDWFMDGNQFVEATEFVPGLIEDEAIYSFSDSELEMTMLTITAALYNIHRKKVVHSDLKRQNIVVAKNSAGNKVGKIIDFDRAYFEDDVKPDYIGGSQNFMSPELVYCYVTDMCDDAVSMLSSKSDVYSLGIVFHNYLTKGEYPGITGLTGALKSRADAGETIYCGEAALDDAVIHVSSKIKEKYLRHLIANMLTPDPAERISSLEVLNVLKNKTVLDVKCETIVIDGESKEEAAKTVTPPPSPKEIVSTGIATVGKKPSGFAAPWADHDIEFVEAEIKKSRYVASEQIIQSSVKCYKFYREDGATRVFNVQNAVLFGLAKKKTAAASTPSPTTEIKTASSAKIDESGEPWEDHAGYNFDMYEITKSGFCGVKRALRGSVRGYVFEKKNGDTRFFTFENLKLMGYMKK